MSRMFLTLLIFISINFTSFAYEIMPAEKEVQISGFTRADKSMTISAEAAGRVLAINYDMGDAVSGDVFAVIDPTFTEYAIEAVNSSLAKLDTNINQLENRIAYLKKEYERVQELFLSEVETESRRDAAKQAMDQAEFEMASVEQERVSLLISLAELKEKLKRHYVKVPDGWQITDKLIEKGEMAAVGQPLGKAGDFRSLSVPLFVDNKQLKALKKNDKIKVFIDGAMVDAALAKVNPAFDEKTRKREIELKVDMKNGFGGMRVDVPLLVETDGIMVHKDAVVSRYANPKVKIKESGKTVDVTIIGSSGDMLILAKDSLLAVGTEVE
jgi:multidrug resistance efflux pump